MRSVRWDTRDAILVSMERALEAVKARDDVSAGLSAFRESRNDASRDDARLRVEFSD